MAEDTGQVVLAQLGVTDNSDLVDRVNERAVEYARERSAELVGKRVLADGTIIDNPDAKWAIDETTRTMIRDTIAGGLADNIGSDAIVEALQDGYAFSPSAGGDGQPHRDRHGELRLGHGLHARGGGRWR
jgi:hypothetical protein